MITVKDDKPTSHNEHMQADKICDNSTEYSNAELDAHYYSRSISNEWMECLSLLHAESGLGR
jgi:hypothetical protein